MKTSIISLTIMLSVPALATAEATAPGMAPNSSVDKWTCEEFLSIDEQFKPKAIYWASAHTKASKKQKNKVLNIEGTEEIIPIVIDACTKEPKATFWQKLKASWKNAETSTKNGLKEIKSDIKDIKTNMINNPTQ